MNYDFAAIEKKWQANWEKTKPYAAITGDKRPKFYGLIEFPYPSGQGLHVGHPRPFTAMDIVTRKKRMQGYNVLFPIGFDAFGLPTENYAIKNHIHPAVVTKNNIENFTKQLKMLGYGFDWDRCVDTTDPKYYKWTQWIFLQMFKHGLAYKSTMPVNWCTSCKCVLANEEVVNGVCERCGSEVIRKEKSQWMLKITAYAQRLLDDLEDVDFIERVKIQQRNWIGRSTGAEITFVNPLNHIDPFGTIILPLLMLAAGGPVFAFAKPVPVYLNNLKHPKRDEVLVSAAGPASNIALACLAAALMHAMYGNLYASMSFAVASQIMNFGATFIVVNLSLAFFNLIPIPPLDGSSIIVPLLKGKALNNYYHLQQYAMPILIIVLYLLPMWTGIDVIGRYFDVTVYPLAEWLLNFAIAGI